MSKYNQIYSDLLASITTERLERGARLPSETELMDSYQASRGTVRKAIELLQERGFAQKIHGKGTFVLSTNPIEFQLGGIVSFQETYPRLGKDVSTEVVELSQIPLEGALLEHIHAEPGSLITRIKRVRRIDGKRVILDINHFVSEVIPGLSSTSPSNRSTPISSRPCSYRLPTPNAPSKRCRAARMINCTWTSMARAM